MKIEQFVMAYGIEQDRIRALLPEGFTSLRPVLRINTEIRGEDMVYVEFNTPVEAMGVRGWLNIAHWEGPEDGLSFKKTDNAVSITAPFLTLTYRGVGLEGGCPAERDNGGCFFPGTLPGEGMKLRRPETITEKKEFCDCSFAWTFHAGDAHGESEGATIPAFMEESARTYEKRPLTAEHAAAIPCRKVLGCYIVRFEREEFRKNP